MGLFDFFKKKETAPEAQEALDKGLEKTKDGFFNKITKAVAGKSTVDDEVLDNLEEISQKIFDPTRADIDSYRLHP